MNATTCRVVMCTVSIMSAYNIHTYCHFLMLASPQYGGNPVSMAIAEATLCVIEDEHLQEHAERVGGFLLAELEALKAKHPQVIGDVRWVM